MRGPLSWEPDSSGTFSGLVVTSCLGQGRPDVLSCPWATEGLVLPWEIWCCSLSLRSPGPVTSSSGSGDNNVSTEVSLRAGLGAGASSQPETDRK